jgi:hypothetical protein
MAKTYVVMDYDCVLYAGTKLADAKAKANCGNWIHIWQNGKMTGYVVYKGNQWFTHYYAIVTPK